MPDIHIKLNRSMLQHHLNITKVWSIEFMFVCLFALVFVFLMKQNMDRLFSYCMVIWYCWHCRLCELFSKQLLKNFFREHYKCWFQENMKKMKPIIEEVGLL